MKMKTPNCTIALTLLCFLAFTGVILGISRASVDDRALAGQYTDITQSDADDAAYSVNIHAADTPVRGFALDARGAVFPDSLLDATGLAAMVDESLAAGNSLRLTIDSALQKAAEDSLAKTLNPQLNVTGAVVVTDMEGRILALADYQKREPGITAPLALTFRAAPGRTLLPLTALAALSAGEIGVNETISDEGSFTAYGDANPPRCWIDPSGVYKHANQTVVEGLSNCCDFYAYTAVARTGIERWARMARNMGLDSLSGIGYPGELPGVVTSPETVPDPSRWNESQSLEAAVGRACTQVTPIAMARYWTALANGGCLYDAFLMEETITPGMESQPILSNPKLAADLSGALGPYLPFIKEGLHGMLDVSGAAAKAFYLWPYRDQTACMISVGKSEELGAQQAAWATGFAPYEKPEVTVVVCISGADHSLWAATIFRDVIGAYLDQRVYVGMLDAPLVPYAAIPGDGHISQEEAAAIALSALPYALSSPEFQFLFVCDPRAAGTHGEYTWYVSIYDHGEQKFQVYISAINGSITEILEIGGGLG